MGLRKSLFRSLQIYPLMAATLSGSLLLSGCNTLQRLTEVGEKPELNPIENPHHSPTYQQVSMPMPKVQVAYASPNSLWRSGSRSFFKDLRASQIGDIVTVVISIDDQADISNSSQRTRTSGDALSIGGLGGFENALGTILPESVDPENLISTGSTLNNNGSGTISRDEQIDLQVAATVIQVLPNGNLVIQGTQETRVNFEVRELGVSGIIRSRDISSQNTISYEQIAEARLSYGGKGHLSDIQEPRWGSQIVDAIVPF